MYADECLSCQFTGDLVIPYYIMEKFSLGHSDALSIELQLKVFWFDLKSVNCIHE